jgi:outer membrane protein assembly factor BamB
MCSVAYADGYLYIHKENGDFVLAEATQDAYREKGSLRKLSCLFLPRLIRRSESAYAYPVIANGRLYICDLGKSWAYDIKASR